jgi:hypothetical protein
MGLSNGFRKRIKVWGYRSYCIPVSAKTGNPEGISITSQDWAAKYNYSKAQIRTLLRHKRIKGFSFKNQFYILDRKPVEDY